MKQAFFDDIIDKFRSRHGFAPALEDVTLLVFLNGVEGALPNSSMTASIAEALALHATKGPAKNKSSPALQVKLSISEPAEIEEEFSFSLPKKKKLATKAVIKREPSSDPPEPIAPSPMSNAPQPITESSQQPASTEPNDTTGDIEGYLNAIIPPCLDFSEILEQQGLTAADQYLTNLAERFPLTEQAEDDEQFESEVDTDGKRPRRNIKLPERYNN